MEEEDRAERSRTQSGDKKCPPSPLPLDIVAKNFWNKVVIDPLVGTIQCLFPPEQASQRELPGTFPPPPTTRTFWVSGLHFPRSGSFTPVLRPRNMVLLALSAFYFVFFFTHCLPCIEAKVAFSHLSHFGLIFFLLTGAFPPDLLLLSMPQHKCHPSVS